MTTSPSTSSAAGSRPAFRPPLQRRSRETWTRALDAGVEILEELGYDGFTIAEVCARAKIPPRAIYDRVDTKEGLFLAVYEHGITRVRQAEEVFDPGPDWTGLDPAASIERAVRALADVFLGDRRFLRAVILTSGSHAELRARGTTYAHELGEEFTGLLGQQTGRPPGQVRSIFTMVFSTLVIRVAYGPGFAAPAISDEEFVQALVQTVTRDLLAD